MFSLRTMRVVVLVSCAALCAPAWGGLRAGVARVSITPLEKGIATPLGGYGERAGKPAEGIHDTIHAKAVVFEQNGRKAALVTLDVCSLPACLVEESLAKAGIAGLTQDNTLMAASHTHAGTEGFAMDRRNVADNPYIGIFSEQVLDFTVDRVAQCLRQADAALQPVKAASGSVNLPGMNRNRRGDPPIDEEMTVLRLDKADGAPYVILVNYTAHGTIMTPREMLVSGGWPGVMQRTVEDLVDAGVTCMYTNGAEGDVSPARYRGGSRWEMAENYGRQVGIVAANLAESLTGREVTKFDVRNVWVDLPPRQGHPDFMKVAGDEYHVTDEQLSGLLGHMFPARAPLFALRINDFQMVTFPGEPITQLGLGVKQVMRDAGIAHGCVAALTSDGIGYILTKDEYHQGGYEATASFYGDGLGRLMLDTAKQLAAKTAAAK